LSLPIVTSWKTRSKSWINKKSSLDEERVINTTPPQYGLLRTKTCPGHEAEVGTVGQDQDRLKLRDDPEVCQDEEAGQDQEVADDQPLVRTLENGTETGPLLNSSINLEFNPH